VRYFISYEEGSEPTERVELPREVARLAETETRDTIALACRSAALSFMGGVTEGWSKLDLAMWLSGPYAHATRFVPRGERTLSPVASHGPPADPCGVEHLADVMDNALMHTLALCEELSLPRGESEFIDEAIARGLLAPIEAGANANDAALLWVPVDAERMRLRDRVRALFAVDYLLSPQLYSEALFVCHRCERVVFDVSSKQLGQCSLHRHRSGIVVTGHGSKAETEANRDGAPELEQAPGYGDSTFGQAG
jgi:hypothetical protein